jgi:two-component system, OmpR family, sensor histidine kinase ChvG
MRLRLKLILIALVAAVFPFAGLRFVTQMEDTLRQGEESALFAQANAVARAAVALDPELLTGAGAPGRIYAQAIDFEIQPDGYVEDWSGLVAQPQRFDKGGRLPVDFLAARSSAALYLWFSIGDLTPVWLDAFTAYPERSDHLVLDFDGARYRIACSGSGSAPMVPLDPASPPLPPAACQVRARGYNVELRVPRLGQQQNFAFKVVDFPVAGADLPQARTGTLDADQNLQPWPIVAAGLDRATLAALLPSTVRMRIISPDRIVLRRSGSLDARATLTDSELSFRRWLRAWVYRALLAPPLADPTAYRFDNLKLTTQATESALQGKASAVWRPAGSRASVVLAAAVPLRPEAPEQGALMLEKTSDALLIWSNRALGSLALGGVITMLLAAGILFGYAGWLSFRIRTLKTATENALTPDGLLRGNFPKSRTVDEVGDLSRSFGKLLEQLGEYNDYLRTLASKLSHELSTPLAVVRSSLENLEHENINAAARTYAQRARSGAERLTQILRAMSEATRMERAIASAEGENFDMRAVITGATAAYRDISGGRVIECDVPREPVLFFGAPELIHQALDKLVDNALSFTPEGGTITITLQHAPGELNLSVTNPGPALPEKMRGRLFDSLVSLRDGKAGSPHLGLGLYIVRLIAELHGGHAKAEDLADASGVVFTLKLVGIRVPLKSSAVT